MAKPNYPFTQYNGPYEWKSDPEHIKRFEGTGWYFTDKGQARGSDGSKPPFKIPESKEFSGSHSQEHVVELTDNMLNAKRFLKKRYDSFDTAREEAVVQFGYNARERYLGIDRMIVGYADKKKGYVASDLSSMVATIYGMPADWRCHGNHLEHFTKESLNAFSTYMEFEQCVARCCGNWDSSDDTIMLFRNTDGSQLESEEIGRTVRYNGNNIESWTTNPNFETAESIGKNPPRTKVYARIPINAIVATCVGRVGRQKFMKAGEEENEIMVCGRFIPTVLNVGSGKEVLIPDFREDHFRTVRSFMRSYLERHGGGDADSRRTSSVFSARWRYIDQEHLEQIERDAWAVLASMRRARGRKTSSTLR